jgi:hypothetical protein
MPDYERSTTALVLGAKDVLVATHGGQRGTAVLAARLEDVGSAAACRTASASPERPAPTKACR